MIGYRLGRFFGRAAVEAEGAFKRKLEQLPLALEGGLLFGGFNLASAGGYAGFAFDTPTPESYTGDFISLTVPTALLGAGQAARTNGLEAISGTLIWFTLKTGLGSNLVTSLFFSPKPGDVADSGYAFTFPAQPWGISEGYGWSMKSLIVPNLASYAWTYYYLI